jgi:hypothetical protein
MFLPLTLSIGRDRRLTQDTSVSPTSCLSGLSYPFLTIKSLRYAIAELQKDVERELALLPEAEREGQRTKFAVFVVHNKLKPKLGKIPDDVKCVHRSVDG